MAAVLCPLRLLGQFFISDFVPCDRNVIPIAADKNVVRFITVLFPAGPTPVSGDTGRLYDNDRNEP